MAHAAVAAVVQDNSLQIWYAAKTKHLLAILLQIHLNRVPQLMGGTVVEGDGDVARLYAILPVIDSQSSQTITKRVMSDIHKRLFFLNYMRSTAKPNGKAAQR